MLLDISILGSAVMFIAVFRLASQPIRWPGTVCAPPEQISIASLPHTEVAWPSVSPREGVVMIGLRPFPRACSQKHHPRDSWNVLKIHQRGVQWKQSVVICMLLYTSLLHNTTPIRCTPLPLHPPCNEYPCSAIRASECLRSSVRYRLGSLPGLC